MSLNSKGIPHSDIASTFLTALRYFPSAQARRGDDHLVQARDLSIEYESVIASNDRKIIEDRITYAEESRVGLDTKSGISKFLQARVYVKASRGAYKYAKHASDRGMEMVQYHHQAGKLPGNRRFRLRIHRIREFDPVHELEDIYTRVTRTAKSLYRCYLSCKDAFPTSIMKDDLLKGAWSEACAREGAHFGLLRQDGEFVYESMSFIADIKLKIMQAVETLYEFNTSQAPESIGRNATRAQALLTNMTFIYRELNFDGESHHPYRHPIIQRVINNTWFKNKDDDGIDFWDHFSPIPIQAIGLALTVVECCIGEWSTGTWKEANWSEERYNGVYRSHLNSLHDLRNHGRGRQGENLLAQIQFDLLKEARKHAGAPQDPITGAGRLPMSVLETAIEEDLPAYDKAHASGTPGITVSESDA